AAAAAAAASAAPPTDAPLRLQTSTVSAAATVHKCDQCGHTFKSPAHLASHNRGHEIASNRRFECCLCDSKFTLACNLRRHMRLYDHSKLEKRRFGFRPVLATRSISDRCTIPRLSRMTFIFFVCVVYRFPLRVDPSSI
ncbi:hypothetical protein PFISCL1PPCAC_23034, partial [Pristionchus fissidentatus]